MRKEINTVSELKAAIKKADVVLICPRFGVSEKWLKLSKIEAMELANTLAPNATPNGMEMYTFGEMDNGVLYLG